MIISDRKGMLQQTEKPERRRSQKRIQKEKFAIVENDETVTENRTLK